MGLDASLYRIKSLSQLEYDSSENCGEEIKYWRKYYALNNWFYSNCKRLNNDIIDGYVVTFDNLKQLLIEAKNQLSGYINTNFDLTENMKYLKELILFLEDLVSKDFGYEYYYEWVN